MIAEFAISIYDAIESHSVKTLSLLMRSPAAVRNARRAYKSKRLLDKAVKRGDIDVINVLLANGIKICNVNVRIWALKNGHRDIVKKLSVTRIIKDLPYALGVAIQDDRLDDVKWIVRDVGPDQMKARGGNAIDRAAAKGRLDIVKWLSKQEVKLGMALVRPRPPLCAYDDEAAPPSAFGCTTDAMDLAAKNGHLEVVKWLHENRTEGCSIDALERAAENGHLEIVKWLCENRREGSLDKAVGFAADEGRTDVVEWILNMLKPQGPDMPPRVHVESREHRLQRSISCNIAVIY